MRVSGIGTALFALAMANGLTTGLAASANAGGVPYGSFGITISPSSPVAGGHAVVTARGFQPGHEVTIFMSPACRHGSCGRHPQFIRLGHQDANANGVVAEKVTIPGRFAPGSTHLLQAVGTENGRGLTESTTVKLSKHRPAGSAG